MFEIIFMCAQGKNEMSYKPFFTRSYHNSGWNSNFKHCVTQKRYIELYTEFEIVCPPSRKDCKKWIFCVFFSILAYWKNPFKKIYDIPSCTYKNIRMVERHHSRIISVRKKSCYHFKTILLWREFVKADLDTQ